MKLELSTKAETTQQNKVNTIPKEGVTQAINNAQAELDVYIRNNQSKLEADEYFSQEKLRMEQEA